MREVIEKKWSSEVTSLYTLLANFHRHDSNYNGTNTFVM